MLNKIIVKPYDWGPGNQTLVLDDVIGKEELSVNDFEVTGIKYTLEDKNEVLAKGAIKVEKVYVKDGEIHLLLEVAFGNELTSPFTIKKVPFLNYQNQVKYLVQYKGEVIAESDENTQTLYHRFEEFKTGVFKHGDIQLNTALYKPQGEGKKPLIIYLHGAGEGGLDIVTCLYGNKVLGLIEENVQNIFGGAYVLVPQSPDMWMNDGTDQYTQNGVSKYTNALISLIEQVIKSDPGIDTQRVYLGGCSNGGFMTINLLLAKPNLFAATFPICEAYQSEWISDDELIKLKNKPIWFVHSQVDPVVNIETTSKEIYNRLLLLGNKDVHLSKLGEIRDEYGNVYNAHLSWIPLLDNKIKGFYQWLNNQNLDSI